MVDILTDTGVFLDLDPAAEFEITIENPLLQDDRIPVPFSTAIAFLATPKNKAVFGYLDTMMLAPTVKQLGASILVGGVQLLAGSLIYDSIDEDGRINYTFSGQDLAMEWSGKLWELTISSGIHYPLIVDASKVAAAGIGTKPSGQRPGNLYNIDGKYRNHPDDTTHRKLTVPAIEVGAILGGRVSFAQVSGASAYLENAVIFGTWEAGLPDPAATLPDITFADFVLALCNMFCAALFTDGSSFRIMAASDILAPTAPLDWDHKVASRFRSAAEAGVGYSLGYSDSEEGNSADEQQPASAATLVAVITGAEQEYETAKHTPTGDIYSRKLSTVSMIGVIGHSSQGDIYGQVGTIDEILIDRVGTDGNAVSRDGEEDVKSVDIGFLLPKCAPSGWVKKRDGSAEVYIRRMAPILSLPATGGDRPTDVYIAIYGNGQACDKGVVIANPDSATSADETVGASLVPAALFEQYHQAYASWLAKDRQLLTVGLDLSVMELAAFRMWQAVRVRSRNFLVAKLSIRVSAIASGVDVSADLISL